MDLNFCARCGSRLVPQRIDRETTYHCSNTTCGQVTYRNAKPCAGVLVEDAGRLLLVRRAVEPFRGDWDIPGGFLREWEHPAEGAVREAREETGLQIELTDLLGIFVDRYGNAGYNTLNVYYRARATGGTPHPADDVDRMEWFAPGAMPGNIAFPDHERHVLRLWEQSYRADPSPGGGAKLLAHVSTAVRRHAEADQ